MILRAGRDSDRPFFRDVLRMAALASEPTLAELGRLTLRERLEALEGAYDTPSKRWYVLEIEEKPIAGVWARVGIHPVRERPEAVLLAVGVLSEYRGRGLGHEVLEYAQQGLWGEGVETIRLFVHPDNAPAKQLYQIFGYQPSAIELTLKPSPALRNPGQGGV